MKQTSLNKPVINGARKLFDHSPVRAFFRVICYELINFADCLAALGLQIFDNIAILFASYKMISEDSDIAISGKHLQPGHVSHQLCAMRRLRPLLLNSVK